MHRSPREPREFGPEITRQRSGRCECPEVERQGQRIDAKRPGDRRTASRTRPVMAIAGMRERCAGVAERNTGIAKTGLEVVETANLRTTHGIRGYSHVYAGQRPDKDAPGLRIREHKRTVPVKPSQEALGKGLVRSRERARHPPVDVHGAGQLASGGRKTTGRERAVGLQWQTGRDAERGLNLYIASGRDVAPGPAQLVGIRPIEARAQIAGTSHA